MIQAKIVETSLKFTNLARRNFTTRVIIHHTGSKKDVDFSAARIHEMHKGQGWAGIGYHFVIRKDGTIERGRPIWAVGSHAQGHNSNSIGIHLCGDFNAAKPTDKQIESAAMLTANLCDDYSIPTDRSHVVEHGELMETDCPGKNLQALLGEIVGKANWYMYGGRKPDAVVVPNVTDDRLSKHFSESEFWCRGQEQGTCNCNHSIYIEPRLIAMLEKLREVCGNRPLYINSGYRCPQHNAAIGGVPDSQHCLGTGLHVYKK